MCCLDKTEQIKAYRTTHSKVTFTRSTYWYEVGYKVFLRWLTHLRSLDLSKEECSTKCEINLNYSCHGVCSLFYIAVGSALTSLHG